MDDTAQNSNNSYVNTYVPPSDSGTPVSQSPSAAAPSDAATNPNAWLASTPGAAPASGSSFTPSPSATSAPAPAAPSHSPSPAAPSYTPPAPPVTPPKPEAPPAASPPPAPSPDSAPELDAMPSSAPKSTSETLESQNIFDLLGVSQASDTEKEAFLDDLQQVIWEDFIENDVQLLLTETEVLEMQKLQTQTYPDDLAKQEALVVYLEKLIPDLEDIMLEKALELKRDMVMERVNGMKEFHAQNQAKLQEITKAESLISQNQWRSATEILNQAAQ